MDKLDKAQESPLKDDVFRQLVEICGEGLIVTDAQWCVKYINEAYTRIFGYDINSLPNGDTFSIVHPDDKAHLQERTKEMLKGIHTGKPVEFRAFHQDGSLRYIEAWGRVLPSGDIAGFLNDITARKQVEMALRENETLFRSIFELSTESITILNEKVELKYANAAYRQLMGYTGSEMPPPQTGFPRIHEEDMPLIHETMAKFLSSYETQSTPCRVYDAEGKLHYLEGYIRRLPTGDIIGVNRNMTETILAQQALAESESLYRSFIEICPDVVMVISADGIISYANPRCEQIYGYAPSELIGSHFTTILMNNDEVSATTFNHLIQNPNEIVAYDNVLLRHKDGRPRIIEGAARFLPNGNIISFSRDITQRRFEENALRSIVQGTSNLIGDEFFRSFVKHLAMALNIQHVYVTTLSKDKLGYADTLAFWSKGAYRSNCHYALSNTPCQSVHEKGFCYYPEKIQELYPADEMLFEIGAESYMGIPLMNSSGELLGHIAVMDDKAMQDEEVRKRILQIFAARASAELERLQAAEALVELNAQLEQKIVERTAELEETLTEQRQLAAIIEATTDYVGIADLEGWSLYVNHHGREMVGKTDEDFLTRWNVASCHPESEHPKLFAMVASAKAGIASSGETIILHKSGRALPVSYVCVPLKNTEGEVKSLAAIMRDISEQKQVADELRAAKELAENALNEQKRLIRIIEATSDMVAMIHPSGQTLYLNRAGREMLGYGVDDDIRNHNLMQHYSPEVMKKITEEQLPYAIANGGVWAGENSIIDLKGHEIPISQAGLVIFDENGELEYLATIARDISERKRFEEELKQAKDAAEAASRAKSTFLANMSHEIRTPMNAIIGMTSLLLDTPMQVKQRDFVETIRSSGDTLLTIINDILDFSKIEADKLDLVYRSFNLRECVEAALDLLAPLAAEKHIDLAYIIEAHVPSSVVGDVTRLRQILVNLLSNAVKFTSQGEVVVTVSSIPQNEKFHELHFVVRDTGLGIPPNKMTRLFKAFSQVDASTTREYGGTGLGLAISKRLTEMMGGTIWAESEGITGRGSSFHFTIQAEESNVAVKTFLRSSQPQLVHKRVLIVDDNATNRRILTLQSQTWGMVAHAAALPSEALSLIKSGMQFDVAILDMHMPEMTGEELAVAIHQLAETRHLPLIMLTSAISNGSQEEFAASLTKPVKPSELYNVLMGLFASAEESLKTEAKESPVKEKTMLADSLPLRILLAEDVLVNQKFAIHALERMGYRADLAANGQEALDAVMRQNYDVIFMDVQMPIMDGLEATRSIRQLAIRQPQIIAMTANAMQGDREICIEAGMDDYVSKPVYLQELEAALERVGLRLEEAEPITVDTQEESFLNIDEILEMGRDLIEAFIEEIPQNLQELAAAIQTLNAEAIAAAAHKIKGSSAYLGAVKAKSIAAKIEQLGNQGNAIEASRLETALTQELEATINDLRKRIEA